MRPVRFITRSQPHLARRILRGPSLHASHASHAPVPRHFSHRHARLLVASHRSPPRPQLPFLHPSTQAFVNGQQLLRLFSISANQKQYLKETARLTVKYTFLIWVVTTLFSIASLGVLSERQERAFPSPHEWSLYTRFRFRRGRWWEVPENNEDEGFPNYARLYNEFQHALKRLEDPNKDGSGLTEHHEALSPVPGTEIVGFDLTAKSEEWRQGYYEVLMAMARAAERLDGWVSDKWRWNAWSPEFIESPSNPRPRATPPGMPPPPARDEQVAIADPPETFYLKVLTSKGFTTYQRVTAALGYADWLAFNKLNASAEEMYHWAVDIAVAGLPTPDHASVINPDTTVLSATAPREYITSNLVYAASNLATFYAATGRATTALPIFISLLRARLVADLAPPASPPPPKDSTLVGTLLSLLKEPDYPPLPPTGDEILWRKEEDRCEEAILKNYIGEILFVTAGSSSQQRQQGLGWVRDGVSTSKIAQSLNDVQADAARKKKCELCEEIGLESWGKIMTYLAAEARVELESARSPRVNNLLWKVWGTTDLEKKVEDLEDEEDGVTMRLNKLRGRMLREEYEEMDRKYSRTFVF